MKKIEALIKPFKLEDVKMALQEIGIEGMTVSEVLRFKKHADKSNGKEFYSMPKIKIELVLPESRVKEVVDTIIQNAKGGNNGEGRFGDGKVYVSSVEEAIRIRTEEKDEHAI